MMDTGGLITMVLAGIGAITTLIAAIGLVRMPDLPTRMHAASKTGTLGAVLLLSAVAFSARDFETTLQTILICLFLFLTAPVASHVIARAAYRSGVPLAEETVLDELREAHGGYANTGGEKPVD